MRTMPAPALRAPDCLTRTVPGLHQQLLYYAGPQTHRRDSNSNGTSTAPPRNSREVYTPTPAGVELCANSRHQLPRYRAHLQRNLRAGVVIHRELCLIRIMFPGGKGHAHKELKPSGSYAAMLYKRTKQTDEQGAVIMVFPHCQHYQRASSRQKTEKGLLVIMFL